jgi:FkbM family methyltransferase
MCLIQIGSGSANYDTYVEDGFTNFVKKNNIEDPIFIIEANSIHLENLKKYWENKKNVKIFNFAIIPDNSEKEKMTFFYSLSDYPNYQIFSNSKLFVEKHFPKGEIKEKVINCIKISKFFEENKIININYLSLDIEGMDYEVLINLDFNKFNIKNISFEHLHLNLWQKIKIIFKLVKNGYFFSGMGFDIRKSDWMFTKDYRSKIMLTYLLPITPRRIWKKYSFSKQI